MRKNTKSALLLSVVSIIVCCTMLLGTTMAWFTDSVTSDVNKIVAGNLDIELYRNGVVSDDNKVNGDTKLFSKDVKGDEVLWEPGVVVYENLKITNEGSLALKYQLSLSELTATEITLEDGTVTTLKDVIKVAVKEDGFDGDRDAAHDLTYTSLDDFVLKGELVSEKQAETDNENVSEETFGIVLYWEPGENDNDYNMNNKNQGTVLDITFGLNLFATQYTYEEDSFDDKYDKDAVGEIKPNIVTTAEELAEALAVGGLVQLNNDIYGAEELVIPEGVTVTLDLNGNTLSNSVPKSDGHAITNNGDLTIVDGTVSSTADNGGSAVRNNGTLSVEDVILNGAPQAGNGTSPSYAINNAGNMTLKNTTVNGIHGAVACFNGGRTVVENCDFIMNGWGGSSHVFYIYGADTTVTVNGGTYTHNGNIDGSLAYVTAGTVTINGGTFSASNGGYGLATTAGKIIVNGGTINNQFFDWGGDIVVTGGTFAKDPTKYLADGYKAVATSTGYIVVSPTTAMVKTVSDVNTALTNSAYTEVILVDCNEPTATVTVPDGKTLTLNNVSVANIVCEGKANLVIEGNVTASAPAGVSAVEAIGDLEITGTGSLTAIGGGESDSENGGSGITAPNITISNLSDVNAQGWGLHAFGIGGVKTETISITDTDLSYVKGGYVQNLFVNDTKYGKNEPEGGAAIGSGYTGAVITLTDVTADKIEGGSKSAGIGAQYHTGVAIEITNSTISNVIGGNASAGIGGSRVPSGDATAQKITIKITDSTVKATGGEYAAGIGSGYDTHCHKPIEGAPMCTINITGSTITAQGGKYAAGIGTGYHNAQLSGEIKNSKITATSGEKYYKDSYTRAMDIGFGVTDPERDGLGNECYIVVDGVNVSLPAVGTQG